MKQIFSIIIAVLLFLPALGFTQTKEIISEGAYNMGDGETPSVAESRALLQAKRVAVEQAGTYVESYSKVKDFKLTEDEIKVLASGLMEVEIVDKKRTIVGDGFNFWVKIKARVNLDKTEEMANKIKVKDKSFVDDYKIIQEAYDKSRKEVEELKKQLAKAKGEKEKKQVEAKITDKERLFQANEWFEKGYEYTANLKGTYLDPNLRKEYTIKGDSKEYNSDKKVEPPNVGKPPKKSLSFTDKDLEKYNTPEGRGIVYGNKGQDDMAIEAFTSAIALNPNLVYAYNYRGMDYFGKGQYDRAIEDYNKAIALDPNYTPAYINRGVVYDSKGQYDRAIEDYNKAIQLDPNDANAYHSRGMAYGSKGQYDRAIEDFNKAIALNLFNDAYASYYNRGFIYARKGQYDRAIEDYNKTIQLNPNFADAYYDRGLAYENKGQNDRARDIEIEDFNKAIQLNPNFADAYYERGIVYGNKGQDDRAFEDFQKACHLGLKLACELVQLIILKNR